MDEMERTQTRIDLEMERSIQSVRRRKSTAIETGACLFCGETVKPGVRWCSLECRDDWEMRHE